MALAYLCGVVALFALVLVLEGRPEADKPLRPAGLLRWLVSGNWTAKLGGLLLTIGSGALLRYLMLHVTVPPGRRILAGIAIAAALGVSGALLGARPKRRAISLALIGASLAVSYLTAYSAYAFFHFVADLQALGLLFIVASVATFVALTRRALSIAVLAMAGAYLAPAFVLQEANPLPIYGYYVVASLLTLLMVWLRGWRPLIHLSFLFTLAGALFFGWTQKFYTPDHYPLMQQLLLALVGIHLAMPFAERRGSISAEPSIWMRTFDQVYFLTLPVIAAILTLALAPRVQHEGVSGFLGLSLLWLLAFGWQQLRSGFGAARYLAIAITFLILAGIIAIPNAPFFLIAAVLSSLLVAANPWLKLNRVGEILAIATALATSACYTLEVLFSPSAGVPLLNLLFAEHLLLAASLFAASWSLHRRRQTLAGAFALFAATWTLLSLARELLRLNLQNIAELAHFAVLLAILVLLVAARIRAKSPGTLALGICGATLLGTAAVAAAEFSPALLVPVFLADLSLLSLLARACDRDAPDGPIAAAAARSALPILALPFALAISWRWSAPNDDMILTILASSALFSALQMRPPIRNDTDWTSWASAIGFTLCAIVLLREALGHIEREAWAVAFEVLGLAYLIYTAHLLWAAKHRDATLFGYVATTAVAAVSSAMLLRIIGPPGTLTILALQQMLLPAVVSLAWATIGAALTWLAIRRQSRILWSLGALLMVAAAVKLILLDFGSLGQLDNILAMMAAGAVFLMVAWLAPFPPRAARRSEPLDGESPGGGGRGWLWIACPLTVAVIYQLWTQN